MEIRRRDGQVFVVRPTTSAGSPLDVPRVNTDLSREEIVGLVRESRRSTERFLKETKSPNRLLKPKTKNIVHEAHQDARRKA